MGTEPSRATKEGSTSAPRGSPGLFCPVKASAKHCRLFRVGCGSQPPKGRDVSRGDEISLVGARGPGENSQQVLFIETVNKGDWPARGTGHGMRDFHLWATASSYTSTET